MKFESRQPRSDWGFFKRHFWGDYVRPLHDGVIVTAVRRPHAPRDGGQPSEPRAAHQSGDPVAADAPAIRIGARVLYHDMHQCPAHTFKLIMG